MSGRQQAGAFCRVDRAQTKDAPAASAVQRGQATGKFNRLTPTAIWIVSLTFLQGVLLRENFLRNMERR